MNKMEQVAALFNKRLNEEFYVKYRGKTYKVKFVFNGIEQCNKNVLWNKQDCLMDLLTGRVDVVGE